MYQGAPKFFVQAETGEADFLNFGFSQLEITGG
jgi:hypothetical protein